MLNNTNIVLALVLGSGVELDESILINKKILDEDISGVHKKLVFEADLDGKKILVFKGRKHFYEGYGPEAVTENVKYAYERGVKNIIFTNAAGGLNENFSVGDLMLITSHINFNDRMVFRNKPFAARGTLYESILNSAKKVNVRILEGVYGCYPGPMYETKAETGYQKKTVLDAAGMSTIPEIYEALDHGMNAAAISVITNLLKENTASITYHDQVIRNAKNASAKLNLLIPELISELN